MLRYMRENSGSWIIKILLGLIVVVFVFLGMGSMSSKMGNKIADVNGKPITVEEYKRSYQDLIAQLRRNFGDNLNDQIIEMLQVKKQALDNLIDGLLIEAEAEKLGIKISDKEIRASVLSVPVFQSNGVFDMDTYKKVLAANRWTPEVFESIQRESLKREKVRDVIVNSAEVSDLEAKAWYTYNNTKIGIDYMAFSPDTYSDVKPDDTGIAAYYEANKDKYKSEPKLKVQYLEFLPETFKGAGKISEERLKEYYDANINRFKVPEKVEARHILIKVAPDAPEDVVAAKLQEAEKIVKLVKDGKDFSELAKEYSQDSSKDSGGYLGFFGRNAMVKPFEDKAFSMAPGTISEPVRTDFGWHIIKVESRIEPSVTTFEMAKKDISTTLEKDELKNYAYFAASKAFDAIIDGDGLEQAGLLVKKEIAEIGPLYRAEFTEAMKNGAAFAEVAFGLPINQISDVKEINDVYYIIKPVEAIAPEALPLEKVRERVIVDLTASMKQDRAKKEAEEALAALKSGQTMQAVSESKAVAIKSTDLFARDSNSYDLGLPQDIIQIGFSLSEAQKLHPELLQDNGRYLIIMFREKQLPSAEEAEKNLANARSNALIGKRNRIFGSWIADLKKNSSIEIKKEFLN
ncbi:MAG: SurA N-terminal domain-containing protein [Pseudomonadota bacterium]